MRQLRVSLASYHPTGESVTYGGKPLRVCLWLAPRLSPNGTPDGERQLPRSGNPAAALVSPPAVLTHQIKDYGGGSFVATW
ncbi:hypothetical protein SAMD00079811_25520 [Scytonema sp. HK-05]|uniref:hypothetical protein n=1 Tax=Scytonema sp. HK-05 TaxID=1137095 RepID=UPI000B619A21|nr:hypothetical protein [Scytonema sp. HK-05]BAY44950.1 hypothetical protein SAMD00079811_25520 [Scytonema sp. HK-05]